MSPHEMDRSRWGRMTILEQMGNISSEVGRSLSAHRSAEQERFDQALSRALDLFDATVECLVGTDKSFRVKEVLRARDQYLQLFFDGVHDASAAQSLERYFHQFAIAARAKR